jgi:hypothetical protein
VSAADKVGKELATAMEDWADSQVTISLELSEMMESAGVTLADGQQIKDAFLVQMEAFMDTWLGELKMAEEG